MPRQKKVVNTKGIKKGTGVKFFTGHGVTMHLGSVVEVVQPGNLPKIDAPKYRDLKKPGFNKAVPRDEKSFLVQAGDRLYWPQNKALVL